MSVGNMKIAIIGCGAIARNRHAPAVAANPVAELYAVCDPVKSNADTLAEKYSAKAFYDMDALLQDPAVDAVIICTPERFHCANVTAALVAGKDVLCEKPLAMNPAEGAAILQAWQQSGRRLMVAFAQRLNEEHQLAKKLLTEGAIGRPIAFRTELAHKGVEYAAIDGPTPDFYDKRLAGVGDVMLSVGCHRVDLVRYLFDSPIRVVSAMTPTIDKSYADGRPIDAADHAMILAEMENGVRGAIWISWCDYGRPERGTTIYGTDGVMRLYAGPGVVVEKRDGSVQEYEGPKDPHAWLRITDHFIAVLRGDTQPVCDGYDGQACLEAMEAIRRSNAQGRRVLVEQSEQAYQPTGTESNTMQAGDNLWDDTY